MALAQRDPEFAYLAHDLSQLLWAIQGRARALAVRLGSDAAPALSIADDAAAAAAMLADSGDAVADPVITAAAAWRQAGDHATARTGGTSRVVWGGPETAPPVAIPAHALRRILGNLFANAIEAMPDGGRVVWEASIESDRVRIAVQDTGSGVAPDVRSRLFEVGATSGKPGGHGLGLASSRTLARRFGGDLVHCETETGTRFELDLPAADSAPLIDLDNGPTGQNSLRILVADDELPVREMLADLLGSEGHEVTLAADHDAVLARWESERYDAALIDLGLPGRDGVEVARSLRQRDPALAVVVLTGWGREKELATLDPGLVDFTATKPIDLPLLRQLLGRAARLTAARRDPTRPKE